LEQLAPQVKFEILDFQNLLHVENPMLIKIVQVVVHINRRLKGKKKGLHKNLLAA
jgi:hypothetical protein